MTEFNIGDEVIRQTFGFEGILPTKASPLDTNRRLPTVAKSNCYLPVFLPK